MGYYINTLNEQKETFLNREGERASTPPDSYADVPNDHAAICVVDNGMFTAAGIIYSQREFEDWNDPTDTRQKQWFTIARDKLYDVSDIKPDSFQ